MLLQAYLTIYAPTTCSCISVYTCHYNNPTPIHANCQFFLSYTVWVHEMDWLLFLSHTFGYRLQFLTEILQVGKRHGVVLQQFMQSRYSNRAVMYSQHSNVFCIFKITCSLKFNFRKLISCWGISPDCSLHSLRYVSHAEYTVQFVSTSYILLNPSFTILVLRSWHNLSSLQILQIYAHCRSRTENLKPTIHYEVI